MKSSVETEDRVDIQESVHVPGRSDTLAYFSIETRAEDRTTRIVGRYRVEGHVYPDGLVYDVATWTPTGWTTVFTFKHPTGLGAQTPVPESAEAAALAAHNFLHHHGRK